jgi:hypothetical protein
MSPKFADAHRHLARTYMERGDVARSLEHERAAQGYGTPSKAAPAPPAPAAES